MQRSIYLLLKGEVTESFLQFPPLFFIIITFVLLAIHFYRKQDSSRKLMMFSFYTTASVVLINYIYKIASGNI